MLLGSSLDEVWGKDFLKKKKKSKKKNDPIDDEILIPDTKRLTQADIRQNTEYQDEFKYPGYDNSFDMMVSSYSGDYDNIVPDNNKYVKDLQGDYNKGTTQTPEEKTITISLDEYNQLKQPRQPSMIEGFNTSDEQFHLLLLYIFTGIFFLMSLDTMYQLGKKSY